MGEETECYSEDRGRMVGDSEVSIEPGHRGRAEPAGDFRLAAVCRTPSAWMFRVHSQCSCWGHNFVSGGGIML